MAFKDLRESRARRSIDLPIDGTTYTVHDVDADTGLWATELWDMGIAAHEGRAVDGAELDDDEEGNMFARLLGNTLEEMRADGVDWSDIKHAAITTLVWVVADEETAEKYWEDGKPGEADGPAKPNRATRRASSAAARKTRSRASTSTTKARRSTPATKAPGPGKKSSPSGP